MSGPCQDGITGRILTCFVFRFLRRPDVELACVTRSMQTDFVLDALEQALYSPRESCQLHKAYPRVSADTSQLTRQRLALVMKN